MTIRTNLMHHGLLVTLAGVALASTACSDGVASRHGDMPYPNDTMNSEQYDPITENDFIDSSEENVSTFSIDVDTASYTVMRSAIEAGRLPMPESVRPEEYVNFFDYGYPTPIEDPFSINLEAAPSAFGDDLHMIRIGLQGIAVPIAKMKPTNLVFLIDTSGSMDTEEKLPLVKKSLHTLVNNLRPSDTVGIVTYGGSAGTLLTPTPISQRQKICDAVDRLEAGGGTAGEAGIVEAYRLAESAKREGGNNRVIILTDGDFNVGRTGDSLFELLDEKRATGISLTSVGYGGGTYNDYTMENIAKRANGNYFYVDTLEEASRIFGSELPSTLEVIAADVKVQVEFNTNAVDHYRLVGYENRLLDEEDFEDDTVDAGELGPEHTVTALYEVALAEGADAQASLVDVRLRYKSQYGTESLLLERGITIAEVHSSFDDASDGFRLAAAVTEYAEILRDSMHTTGERFDDILSILNGVRALPEQDKRDELEQLVTRAKGLK